MKDIRYEISYDICTNNGWMRRQGPSCYGSSAKDVVLYWMSYERSLKGRRHVVIDVSWEMDCRGISVSYIVDGDKN